jgi:WD40 repeat protein
MLATGDGAGYVYLWNPATRRLIGTFPSPALQPVLGLAFSPNAATIAVGDNGHDATLWDAIGHGQSS